MTVQWLRRCSLIVGDQSGQDALELSELRIVFGVRHRDLQNPSLADIRIFNLSDATATRLMGKEFTRVVLQAGYQDTGSFGIIFSGEIKQVRRGRLSPVDTYLDIFAADGDSALNYAVIAQALAAGYTQADVQREYFRNLADHNITPGFAPAPEDKNPRPRGRVLYGMTRDNLREYMRTNQRTWSIINGQIQEVPQNGYVPGTALVLNSHTGMIGLPQQTLDGIVVKTLLNPNLRHGRYIQIDQASVQRARVPIRFGEPFPPGLPDVAVDGFYRIVAVDHAGDTRGNPWYSDLVCVAIHGSPGLSRTLINMDID